MELLVTILRRASMVDRQGPSPPTMDYSQLRPPPPPQLADPNQSAWDAYYASYYPYYQSLPNQTQNPNHNSDSNPQAHESIAITADNNGVAPPPGIESYASAVTYTDAYADSYQTVGTTPNYNLDPNARNWDLKEAIRLYGIDPNGYAGAAITIPANGIDANSSSSNRVQIQPYGSASRNKRPKKTKTVQSAYCEICKVDCNSLSVLQQHKLGKKHQKNSEKLQASLPSGIKNSSSGSGVPTIGPQENPSKRESAAESVEDLERKRRRVVEGGAAAESVRTCMICNVVCNSEVVFSDHLAGQKHAVKVSKKAAAAQGKVASAT